MEKRKTGARRRQAGRKRTAIVQDVLPIADVKGPYAITKDGSRVGFLELPGINHSLYTEEQKKDEAYAMADVIASIPVEFAILKYPLPAPAAQQLTEIDRAISRERSAMFSAPTPQAREAAELKVKILEQHMRPDAVREATSGARTVWPNWVALRFSAKMPEEQARRTMDMVEKMCDEKLGEPARRAEESDVRTLLELYLTPSAVAGSSLGYTMSCPSALGADDGKKL